MVYCTEFINCEEKKAKVIVPKSKVPKGRKIIINRWVYAEEDEGTYRGRTAAKGSVKSLAKTFKNIILQLSMMLPFQKLVYNLHSRQFDIVTALLYGLLDEEIYMEFPEGYEQFLK
jgi:Reverse transcriptase (RNA-dependent DNA polymerase)